MVCLAVLGAMEATTLIHPPRTTHPRRRGPINHPMQAATMTADTGAAAVNRALRTENTAKNWIRTTGDAAWRVTNDCKSLHSLNIPRALAPSNILHVGAI